MLGHRVAVLDMNAFRHVHSAESIRQEITDPDIKDGWDVICIGGLHSTYKEIKRILPILRNQSKNAIIMAGGSYITHLPFETMKLNPEIDCGAIGEGEETFREMLQAVKNNNWKDVRGIVYREKDEIILNDPRPQIQDLDTIPYPAYHLIPLEVYFQYSPLMLSPESMVSRKRMSFVWERGCPRMCRFCSHAGMSRLDMIQLYGKDKITKMEKAQAKPEIDDRGTQMMARWPSPKYAVENVFLARWKYGIDFASILDENMLSNRKWTEEFCQLYMERGLHEVVSWGSLGDAPSVAVNPDLVRVMKEAACKYISFGFESASDRTLANDIGKGQTQKHEQIAVDTMVKNGLNPVATFMLGNPTETVDDLLETVMFWIKNRIEVDPFICTPYPGSAYFYKYRRKIEEQYDYRLEYVKDKPGLVNPEQEKEWRLAALDRFLNDLDDATVLTATISEVYHYGDLLAFRNLMHMKDMGRILKFAHYRNFPHQDKWKQWCPVCKAQEELKLPEQLKTIATPQVRQGIAF